MRNKLDELFKKNTGGYQKQPSAEAWNKINKNLHPKTKMSVWQIAASILLVAGVAAVIYLQVKNEGNQSPAVAESGNNDTTKIELTPVPPEEMIAQQPNDKENMIIKEDSINHSGENNEVPALTKKPEIMVAEKQKEPAPEKIEKETIKPEILQSEDALADAVEIPENPIAAVEVENATNTESKRKRPTVTIVYQKSTSETTTVAKNQEKDSKEGLGKIFNLAQDLKNGELALSEIREVKDEIFALDINIKRNNAKTRD